MSFLIFFSCQTSIDSDILEQFETNVKLSHEGSIEIKDIVLKFPEIKVVNDTLLVLNTISPSYISDDYLIHLISLKTGEPYAKIGRGGRGPNEILAINNVGTLNDNLYFYDALNSKILYYNIEKDSTWYSSVRPQSGFMLRNLHLSSEQNFVSAGFFGSNMYCFGKINETLPKYGIQFPLLPGIEEEKQDDFGLARSYAYIGKLMKHPTDELFAFYTRLLGSLQIVSVSNDEINEINRWELAPPNGKPVFKVDNYVWANDKESPFYFIDGSATEKFIYLLYSGKPFKNSEYDRGNYVFVFDWNGTKIKSIELDRPAYNISVANDDSKLFTFTLNDQTIENEILFYTF